MKEMNDNNKHIENELIDEQIDQSETKEPTTEQIGNEKADEQIDEFQQMKEELDELKDAHLRLRAEYDNYRKRTLKEKSDLIKYGGEKTIKGFLGIMDDLELALKNIESAESVEGLVEGVELIQNKFIAELKAQGVNQMDVLGQAFDAEDHDAIAIIPVEDKEKKGKILEVVQTGYTLNDKVIRHPKVVVGS